MNRKKIEQIILNIKKVYNLDEIQKMAEKHLFVRRKGGALC
ncbi:hypothetical protein [Clostridium gasigenes]|nr:hypothetical protein [Clostridium gasigenes]